jgi:predicted MPP superfamily phosphohydrolase
LSAIVGSVSLLFIAADWTWLYVLPKWNVSFGPVKPALIGLIGTRLFLSLLPLAGYVAGLSASICVVVGALAQLLVLITVVYATCFEPFRLGVTHIELETPKLTAGKRVRLVQISDLHIERITRRERDLVERVNALGADYILLTGDYLSLSYASEPRAIAEARQVLGALRASVGLYAVRGTHQVDPNATLPVLFDGLPIRWLRNEHLTVSQDGYRMAFAGASCTRRRDIDVPAAERALAGVPEDVFTVFLYHTPDLVPQAAEGGVDLYLAGHTHGGQIRLPLYGALITATDAGKRYEMGRYDVNGLTLYVSRGLGMEGMAAPRARFLCPPEIVCIDIKGSTA